jgi:hypothetical protein
MEPVFTTIVALTFVGIMNPLYHAGQCSMVRRVAVYHSAEWRQGAMRCSNFLMR